MRASQLNRQAKRWPGWALMMLVIAGFIAVGATRDSGPQTPEDRVDEVTKRLACPVCDGESVFESQNNSSRAIRNEVADLVRENELSDDEILAVFEARNSEILLVPKATGFDALVWVLPVMGFIIGTVALGFAFRRWKLEAEGTPDATDDDRRLVAAALIADDAAEAASSGAAKGSGRAGTAGSDPTSAGADGTGADVTVADDSERAGSDSVGTDES